MQSAADQIETLLAQTNPGFSIFADFSHVAAMDLELLPFAHSNDGFMPRS
jgi:hypothetical protein